MKVTVFGATGNVGWATMRALAATPEVTEIVGVARRRPIAPTGLDPERVQWRTADLASGAGLADLVEGADAVVHLAWRLHPAHDDAVRWATNVAGTRRLVEAMIARGAPKLVYASSVGAYSPGPKDPRVDESWPVRGTPGSWYARHKAEVEAMLDDVEQEHPELAIVRLRTSLVFQRAAASEIHRLFLGQLLPWRLPRPLRVVPSTERLAFQATHSDDVADAYVRAVLRDVRGPFNVAAEPVLTPAIIAEAVGGRPLPVPAAALRLGAAATFHARVQPTERGWVDMALGTPIMDCSRARRELDWDAQRSAVDALTELLGGIGDGAGGPTAPLEPRHRAGHRRLRVSA